MGDSVVVVRIKAEASPPPPSAPSPRSGSGGGLLAPGAAAAQCVDGGGRSSSFSHTLHGIIKTGGRPASSASKSAQCSPNSSCGGSGGGGGVNLQVSMDDAELFPKGGKWQHGRLERSRQRGDGAERTDDGTLSEMCCRLSRLWWSRLMIACRGYVMNDACARGESEQALFCVDDAFIEAHKRFVERPVEQALRMAGHMHTVLAERCVESLAELAAGYQLSEEQHPFYKHDTADACRRLFGLAVGANYVRAYRMLAAYGHLHRVLHVLMRRWRSAHSQQAHSSAGGSGASTPRKSVKFEKDPEWEPDERVVVFQEFFHGNRTWVLLDFDRRVLAYHRPHGVLAIFGERYIQAKLDEGYALCQRCGMLEQCVGQFAHCPQCQAEAEAAGVGKRGVGAAFCSSECLSKALPQHIDAVHGDVAETNALAPRS